MYKNFVPPPSGVKQAPIIPASLLDDIASRFIFDAPDAELKDPIYLCFMMELAYWFYLDEYVEEDNSLNNIKFELFAIQLLSHVGIKPENGTVEDMLQNFRDFKIRVPTYGGLLLNEDLSHVLLVQGFWTRASWGFPKGKINVDEEPHCCAIREVLEETGYDISHLIDKNQYLETSVGEQFVRLYIIPGVPMDTEFAPRTKGEIKSLKWFPVHQLPAHKNDRNYNRNSGSTNIFYMVMPFIKPLREWLASRTRSLNNTGNGRESRGRHRSSTSISEHHNHSHHSHSPAAPHDPARKATPDAARKQQVPAYVLKQEEIENYEQLCGKTDNSPWKRESNRGKSKKVLFEGKQEDNQKFTFKTRGKGQSSDRNNPTEATEDDARPFRSYSWQIFQINRKEVNEAIDRVWAGVTLSW